MSIFRAASWAKRLAWAALALSVSACSFMPASGPSLEKIEEGSQEIDAFPYVLLPVDADVISALWLRDKGSLSRSLVAQSQPAQRLLGVGDLVSVTIWESAPGGLFSASASTDGGGWSVGGANAIKIPPQRIDPNGRISVPYAGVIKAASLRPDQVADRIVKALKGRAIEPQALVTVDDLITNQATVIGDAIQGGRIPLAGENERILDVIATAGGITAPIYSVSVRLTRGAETAEAPLHQIISNPYENIIVQPGDVITLYKNPETFTAFGATGRSTLASFDDEALMLDEALAKVGGVIDARGDPAGVFVFRYEPISMLRKIDSEGFEGVGPDAVTVPVAYQVDLREPQGLFFARNFPMQNKDVLFVANAEASELRKVLGLVGAALSPASTSASIGRAAN